MVKEVVISGKFLYTIVSILVVLSVIAVINAAGVVSHNYDEVDGGIWNVTAAGFLFPRDGNVKVGGSGPATSIATEKLEVEGDVGVGQSSDGTPGKIVFPSSTQWSAYRGDFYCPGESFALNIGGDEDERIFHQGCEDLGNGQVKVKNIRVCLGDSIQCTYFDGDRNIGRPADQNILKANADRLCRFLGYNSVVSWEEDFRIIDHHNAVLSDITIGGQQYVRIEEKDSSPSHLAYPRIKTVVCQI